jgi:hypothetical protein
VYVLCSKIIATTCTSSAITEKSNCLELPVDIEDVETYLYLKFDNDTSSHFRDIRPFSIPEESRTEVDSDDTVRANAT